MTVRAIVIAVLCLAVGGAFAGQKLYRWTDADGQVYYTDKPPPRDARQVEQKKLGDRAGSGPLPYGLQQAVKNFPVTVFTSNCGEACDAARRLLAKRGVPHSEKNARDALVQADMKKLTGSGVVEVPVLVVGRNVVRGWEEGQWNAALDAAGYPQSSVLPKGAPVAKPAAASDDKPAPAPAASADEGAAGKGKP